MEEKHTRREFLGLGAGLAGILATGCSPFISSGRGDEPNIILVTTDTARYDRMGFSGFKAPTIDNGHLKSTSPYLDELADSGTVFHRNYSQANNTWASLGSMFNSRFPSHLHSHLRKDRDLTLTEVFGSEGYQVFGASSSSILSLYAFWPVAWGILSGYGPVCNNFSACGKIKRGGDESAQVLLNMLNQRADKNKPIFAYLHIFQPHLPYMAPEEFRQFHTEGDFSDEPVCLTDSKGFRAEFVSEKSLMKWRDLYNSEILWADANIRGFIGGLTQNGFFDSNRDLFILTSDHGEDMGDHGFCSTHIGLYDPTIHVPLFMCGRDVPRKRVTSLTMNLDVAPTICELAGIDAPESWTGRSLVPLMNGRKKDLHSVAFSEDWQTGKGLPLAVISGGFKYIHREPLPDSVDELPSSRESFSPSGILEYPGDSVRALVLSWPDVSEGRKDIYTKITMMGKNVIFKDGICISHPGINLGRLVSDNGFCHFSMPTDSEYTWNMRFAGRGVGRWIVEVFEKRGEAKKVLLNSGLVKFLPQPSDNFTELYDLEKDISEMNNLARVGVFDELLKKLQTSATLHMSKSNEELVEEMETEKIIKKMDPKIVEDMKALGYLQ